MTNEMLKKLENDGRFDGRDKEAIAKCLDTDAAWDADACAAVCKLADMTEDFPALFLKKSGLAPLFFIAF